MESPALAPITLTPRDGARVEITTRLIAAVMTGYMAGGKRIDDALSAAERSRDQCLTSAGYLFDVCMQDYPADGLEKARLSSATDLFCAAVSALVARGDDPGTALRTAGSSRDHMLRTANGNVLATIDTTIRPEKSRPDTLNSTLAAFRDSRSPGQRSPRGQGSTIL